MKFLSKERSDSILYFMNQLIINGLPFFLLPVVTLVLDISSIGRWGIFTVLMVFLRPFSGYSLSVKLSKDFYRLSESEKGDEVRNLLFMQLMGCILLMVIILPFKKLDSVFGLDPYILLTVPVILLFANGADLVNKVWQYERQSVRAVSFELITNIMIAVLDIFFICYLKIGWQGFVYSRLVCNFTAFTYSLVWVARKYGMHSGPNFHQAKTALLLGLPFAFHIFSGALIGMIDRVVIEHFFTMEKVGLYAVGCMAAGGMRAFMVGVNRAWGPWTIRQLTDGNDKSLSLLSEKIHYLFVVMTIAAVISMVCGIGYVLLFLGEVYHSTVIITCWASLAYLFQSFYQIISHQIIFRGKTDFFMKTTLVVGALNLILTIAMVRLSGIVGAIQATAISFFVQFIIFLIYIQRRYPIPTLFFIRGYKK